jgi:hypothetical protein
LGFLDRPRSFDKFSLARVTFEARLPFDATIRETQKAGAQTLQKPLSTLISKLGTLRFLCFLLFKSSSILLAFCDFRLCSEREAEAQR